MNWDALGAIAELLGAIAVFLTLAYLTVQVRQNSKALEQQNKFSAAQIMQARTDTVMEFTSVVLMEPENLKVIAAINELDTLDIKSMQPSESARFRMVLTMARSMFENNFQQARQGFLSEDFYSGSVIRNLETFGEAFLKFGTPMSDEFRAEVERILEDMQRRRIAADHAQH
jgi:hypothetical protein